VWRGRGRATVAAATRDTLAARDPADAQAATVATTAEAVVDASPQLTELAAALAAAAAS
jgi:hypothetical protein